MPNLERRVGSVVRIHLMATASSSFLLLITFTTAFAMLLPLVVHMSRPVLLQHPPPQSSSHSLDTLLDEGDLQIIHCLVPF